MRIPSRYYLTCWCFFLTTSISTGITPILVNGNQDVIQLPKPACFIEYEGVVDRCTFSRDSNGGQLNNGYIIQNFNGSEGIWNNDVPYANISVNFPIGFHGILQVVVQQFRFSSFSLQIDLRTSPVRNNHPFKLKVFYLPYSLGELSMLQLRNSYLVEDPCHLPENRNECTVLLDNSTLSMKSKKNSIELHLNQPFTQPLKVELYGRPCHSSCNEMYPSCPTNLTSFQWSNPLVEFTVHDLQSAYYCARVIYSVHGQDCCNIFTTTAGVHYFQWLPHSAHNFHLSTYFYIMLIVLTLMMVVIGLIHLRGYKGIAHSLPMKAHELPSKENSQLITVQKLEAQEIEIFLLYPKKDKKFMDTMSSFRKLLKVYAKYVFDPLDIEQIEEVARNPARWMQHVLSITDLKIVLVETEEALAWFDDDCRMLDIDNDDLYCSAISFINNQPELIFNYRQLLVVRFNHFNTNISRTLNMVPQKRYNMPHQLGLLIMDITYSHEYSFDNDDSLKDTVDSFYKSTEAYQH